jgi:nitronate monooxygenase
LAAWQLGSSAPRPQEALVLETRFTKLVGCTVPIQNAGMGTGVSTPELAAAVSGAGGLGMIGFGTFRGSADELLPHLERARSLTSRPLGANFIVRGGADAPPVNTACLAAAASLVRVVELFLWTTPDPRSFDVIHGGGALALCQVGSAAAARRAVDAGADVIVAQGYEAGGHVIGTVGVLPLLGEVLEAVDVPVLAAGGIGTPRALAAVLAAGADGARVGTRFVAAAESRAHPIYRQGLIDASASDTVHTGAFAVGWDAPHRVLRSALEAAEAFEGDVVGARPGPDGTAVPIRRFGVVVPAAGYTGAIEAMPLWAGQSAAGVKRVQAAAEIVSELAEGAERLLRRWA